MSGSIRAVFENSVLRPLEKVALAEHEEVKIVILNENDDISPWALAQLAMTGGGFDFLNDPAEHIYTPEDGEPL